MTIEDDGSPSESVRPVDLGPLSDHVGFLLGQAQKEVFRSFVDAFRDLDIKPHQYGMMTVIERNPGIKPSQIGEALDLLRANVGPAIRVLEKRGLIRRRKDARDGRAYGVELTQQGRNMLGIMRDVHDEHERHVRLALESEEIPALLRQLRSIATRLEEDRRRRSPQKET